MKKIVSVLVLLIFAGAGGAAWYVLKKGSSGPRLSPEAVLPADTMAVVMLTDAAAQIEEFRNSPLGKAIEGIDFEAVLTRMEAPPQTIGGLQQYREDFSSKWNTAVFNSLFGQEAVIGFLPVSLDAFKGDAPDPEILLSGVVLAARPRQDAALLSFLGQWIPNVETVDMDPYQGVGIQALRFENGRELFTATKGGVLLGSFTLKALQEMIGTATGSAPSLAGTEAFRNVDQALQAEGRILFAYADVGRFMETLEKRLAPFMEDEQDRKAWAQITRVMKGWNEFGYAGFDDGSALLLDKARVSFDRSRMDASQLAVLDLPPRESVPLRMMPADTGFFAWDSGFDLKFTLESQLGDPELVQSVESAFETETGIPAQSVYDALGHEIAFSMTEVNVRGMFPVPHLSLVLEAKQPEVLDRLMDKAFDMAGASMQTQFTRQTEEVDGVTIQQVAVPFGADIRPSWALIDNYYVVAMNPDIIRKMLSVRSSGNGLASDATFRSVDQGLSGVNKSVSYLRVDRLMDTTLDLARWGQAMSSMQNPDAAAKIDIAVREILTPVLTGVKMYKAIGSRSCVKDGVVESNAFTHVNRTL